ncbi:hypothetical protein [Alteromonas gilva]|uniref:Uncharacterized protein n=1 Tax=Alteromonas gilva TaxID=2987522 RepID=A0ABT5KY20_9ALTE|nr:hypothetical protein [Alteromonas gilva]MDC8829665.1 hypothetical protein [Alteromonas gilva]
MKLRYSVLFCALPLVFSAPSTAHLLVNLNEFPEWFQQAMERETEIESTSQLTIEALNVDARIKGNATQQESTEGTWYYTIDIGLASLVECYAFTEFDGPANSLHAIVQHSLQGAAALNQKALTSQFNLAVDAGVTGATPYLQLDTLYNLGEGSDTVSGVIKGLSAQTEQSLQICIHNETGYQATFLAVFESFVEAFAQHNTNPQFFDAVYQLSLNDMPLGFSRERFTVDQDGDIEVNVHSAMLVPVDEVSVSRTDSVGTEWSRADGTLINGTEYSVDNGTLSSNFAIQPGEESWMVSGEMQGKAIEAPLNYNGPLISGYGSYTETAGLLASEEQSAAFRMWVPDADPTAALEVMVSKIEDNPAANLRLDMGPLTMTLKAEDNGMFDVGTLEQAGMKLLMKRIYSKGEPVLP